ncbi:DUF4439 domain-containing protein [Synechococcales cyanobacterium C]|uniref:DUF4439 domain-containing protein n=1 Tax=Petrachloros mirabilis ULC683 TaxID=2781853 RepID=A0A8K2A1D0_9CYAN|nr:ferritin-like domain-containing protein [Petrachloros mirabilis]NCJ08688.1 DUF4439 domain-containing protein [Petrachloros mirabilis ULC683]
MFINHKLSRRGVLAGGAIAGLSGTIGLSALQRPLWASTPSKADAAHDVEILNTALFYENQAVWAYGVAASELSDSEVGRAVLAIGLANQADHKVHRDTLKGVITSLGGTPIMPRDSYDLSTYLESGEGNLDSDVNIAKLALALETDAAIAYGVEAAKLKTPALVTAAASIATAESAHATVIRAAFASLGIDIQAVAAPFVNADTRDQWVINVS